jgi:hypothetical protein
MATYTFVGLGKFLSLFGPQFLHLYDGVNLVSPWKVVWHIIHFMKHRWLGAEILTEYISGSAFAFTDSLGCWCCWPGGIGDTEDLWAVFLYPQVHTQAFVL